MVQNETTEWEISFELTQASQNQPCPVGFVNHHHLHHSFHYISHSPLNLIISARVPEPSLGLRMAMVLS